MRSIFGLLAAASVVLVGSLCAARLAGAAPLAASEPEGEQAGQPDRPGERAAWNAARRRDPQGRVLAQNRWRALQEACDMPVDPAMRPAASGSGPRAQGRFTFGGTRWESIGPRPIQSVALSNQSWGNVSGRVSAVAVDPADESTLLLASATGGIWKSTDAGAHWRPVSDTTASLATSHICYAASNPAIVYAATGEVDNAGAEVTPSQSFGTYLGAGLLRSADGGETWSRVDLDLPREAVLSRVLVSQTDPQTVLVGIYLYQDIAADGFHSGGIYRSTDGGVHFTQTFVNRVSDMVQDPGDPRRVYLGAGRCGDCSAASGVYVSTDFGTTWEPSLTPANPVAGFTSPSGRVRLGATRAGDATILYASVLDANNEHTGAGIYRSADGGATWAKITADPTMCPKAPAANQCFYDHWITPAGGSSSTVYFGSIALYKSTDSGATWSKIDDPYNRQSKPVPVHPDQHMGVASANSTDTLYFCTDGGLYRTKDGGATFDNLNTTLTLAQFNGVALHPGNANFAMGGTQDNGNLRYTGDPLWTDRTAGDGGFNIIRPDDPATILSANYYAFLSVSHDGGSSYTDVTPCGTLMNCANGTNKEPMAFYVPAAIAPAAHSTVFLGTNRIWKHTGFADDPAKWAPQSTSPILATGGDVVTALAVAGEGTGILWAGSVEEGVFLSSDGGATFSPRNTGLPAAYVSSIVIASPDGRSAYVTFAGFLGAPSRHVYRTTDAGATWANLSGNLPDVPVAALAVDPTDVNDLFVGTDVGVFRSVDGGAHWTSFNEGLPTASVYGLAFHPATQDLFAATYGRGMFRTVAPPLPPVADYAVSPAQVFAGYPALFVDTSLHAPLAWSWDFGDPASGAADVSAAKNPQHTFSAPGVYTVTLTVSNALGSSQVSRTVTVSPGGPCERCSRVTPFR
ncbi:MAG TPA: PKD domain-containing protein [Thermoanaerobaculia bacterium]|nr:PKD domain-containing protein [Thermoanaerobaculia bacterium]